MCTLKASKNARLLLAFLGLRVIARFAGVVREFGRWVRIRVCCRCCRRWHSGLLAVQTMRFVHNFQDSSTNPVGNLSLQAGQSKLKDIGCMGEPGHRLLVLGALHNLPALEALLGQ